ncbi:MAG: peptide deformylase [Patescibacteria group bacterium]|nr:peptide deformylase [Patescibacteria group bacterium]
MPLEILQKDAPLLRKCAEPIPVKDIVSSRVQKLIRDMRETLEREEDGVALAAPQIGVLERIFIVSPRAFLPRDREVPPEEYTALATAIATREKLVYINPEVVKRSRERRELEEGCLSVRWLYGKVSRATRASVRAYDERGKPFTRGARGLLAEIFQHEVDHLDGILFIDKAKDVRDIPPTGQQAE